MIVQGQPDTICIDQTISGGKRLQGCDQYKLFRCTYKVPETMLNKDFSQIYCVHAMNQVKFNFKMKFNTPLRKSSIPSVILYGLFLNGWIDLIVEVKSNQTFQLEYHDSFKFDSKYYWEIIRNEKLFSDGFLARKLHRLDSIAIKICALNFTGRSVYLVADIHTNLGGSQFNELQSRGQKSSILAYYYKVNFKLNKFKPDFTLSVPGFYETLTIKYPKKEQQISHFFLKVYYLTEAYWIERDNWKECVSLSLSYKYSYCLNYTSGINLKKYFLYFRKVIKHNADGTLKSREYKSWHQANDFCKSVGGILPVFRNNKELNEVLSMFKMHLFPAEAIYIGMIRGKKVSGIFDKSVRVIFLSCSLF